MRKIFRRCFVALAALCFAGVVVCTLLWGFTVGNAIACAAGAFFLFLGVWFPRFPKRARRILGAAIWAGVVFFFTVLLLIVVDGERDTADGTEDCVLVLGAGVRGEQVLPVLQARLDRCVEYLAVNPGVPVVVSGGQGSREHIDEAEAMRRYLEAQGVPAGQIFMERRARNTKENIKNAKPIIDSLFCDSSRRVACITSDFHLYRTRRIVRDAGVPDVYYLGAGVPWYQRPSVWSREVLSVCKYWLSSRHKTQKSTPSNSVITLANEAVHSVRRFLPIVRSFERRRTFVRRASKVEGSVKSGVQYAQPTRELID